MVMTGGLETLGPQAIIPLDRAMNVYRAAGAVRRQANARGWMAGFEIARRQMNGAETDAHRGFFSFGNDFGRDAITNLRMGTPSQHIVSIGDVHRGFRSWESAASAGGQFRLGAATDFSWSLRWQAATRPVEVNGRNVVPYDSDLNNWAPSFGVAQRLGSRGGVFRAAAGVHFGEIFPVTYSQVRFSPPGSVKIAVPAPDLLDPLRADPQKVKGNIYALDPELATPYSYQYNAGWEREIGRFARLEAGYVGSRSHKLLIMWYCNRARPVPGIPLTTATINDRRPDTSIADLRQVLNGSRGYYDAARITLVVRRSSGLSMESAYWFSKALDLGSAYTNTAYDADSRLSRSQWEFETRGDMKSLSDFDQPQRAARCAAGNCPAWCCSKRARRSRWFREAMRRATATWTATAATGRTCLTRPSSGAPSATRTPRAPCCRAARSPSSAPASRAAIWAGTRSARAASPMSTPRWPAHGRSIPRSGSCCAPSPST
jgi:hypothetical protein